MKYVLALMLLSACAGDEECSFPDAAVDAMPAPTFACSMRCQADEPPALGDQCDPGYVYRYIFRDATAETMQSACDDATAEIVDFAASWGCTVRSCIQL